MGGFLHQKRAKHSSQQSQDGVLSMEVRGPRSSSSDPWFFDPILDPSGPAASRKHLVCKSAGGQKEHSKEPAE